MMSSLILSLLMEEAQHTLCLFIQLDGGESGLGLDSLCDLFELRSPPLQCFFLKTAAFMQFLEICHENQLSGGLPFGLLIMISNSLLGLRPFCQARLPYAAVCLLQFACFTVADPDAITKDGNSANIRRSVAKLILN